MKKCILSFIACLVAAGLLASQTSRASTASQNECLFFKETGKSLCNSFLSYWNTHGGVPQQGFPVSEEIQEVSQTDGKTYTVQYFERAVFELHPENKGTSSEVLLSLLGSQRYLEVYGPDGAPNQRVSTDNPLAFAETGRSIGGLFRTYWEQNGGLAQQGYPISDEFEEASILDGKKYKVQYFQRSVFELHTENVGTPYEVLLTQLGGYSFRAHYGSLSIPGPSSPEFIQRSAIASDRYFVWTDAKPPEGGNPLWNPSVAVDIRAIDLLNGQVITVTTEPVNEGFSAISGSIVVGQRWNATPGCSPCSPDVIGKDLSTGATYTFATGPGTRYSLQVSGRNVAWAEQNDQTARIVVMDMDTRAVTIPFSRSVEALGSVSFQLSDQYLVWAADVTTGSNSYIDMRSYSFSDGQTRQLAYFIGITPHMELSGRYLVWQDQASHLTNLDTGTTRLLSEGDTYDGTVRGDTLVWVARDVAAQTSSTSGHSYKLIGMKQSDMQPRALMSFSDSLQFWIAGDWLIWKEDNSYTALPVSQAFRDSQTIDATLAPDKGATAVQASIQSRVVGADNQLFWLSAGTANRVYRYDARTQKKTILYQSPEQKLTLATDGHALVWIEFSPMGRYRIMHYDLATSEVSTVVQTSAPDYNSSHDYGIIYPDDVGIVRPYLAVDAGVLYYTDTDPGHKGLWARILVSGQEQLISSVGQSPVAADGRLVWFERKEGFGDLLHLRTTALSGAETILTNEQYYFVDEYVIAGDNVLWIGRKVGRESLSRYNMTTGMETTVYPVPPNDQVFFSNLAMSGNTAVWTEEGSDGTGGVWSIRSLNLSTGLVRTVRTADSNTIYETRAMPNEQAVAYLRRLPSTAPPEGDLFIVGLP